MRNDAHDEINDLPQLSAARTEPVLHISQHAQDADFTAPTHAAELHTAPTSNVGVGFLSALIIALLCASGAFAWWSVQRIQQLEQQIIATQAVFVRISEDAADRIKAISGQFTATESSASTDTETLKTRLNTLESAAVEQAKQQHIRLTEYSARLTQLNTELTQLREVASTLDATSAQQQQTFEQQNNSLNTLQQDFTTRFTQQEQQLASLHTSNDAYQQQRAQLNDQVTALQNLSTQLAQLQKNSVSVEELGRLRQDILILRSEVERRATVSAAARYNGPSLTDFDAYRAQTNRTINALQEQVRQLQKNTR